MNIDAMKARFAIRKYDEQYAIYAIFVKYDNCTFVIAKGTLPLVREKFIRIVQNRELLRPVLERALQKRCSLF